MDFLHGAMILAAPLLLAALGELISERAGVLNIGLEGMMLCGALAAFMGAHASGSAVAGLFAAVIAGTTMAGVFALMTVVLRADQVITGTGVNLVGLGLTGAIYRAAYSLSSATLSITPLGPVKWPIIGSIPVIGPLLFTQNPLVPVSIALAPIVWWFLYRTRTGLMLRACGEKPEAADTAGYSVVRLRFLAVLIGGALAGLGGGYLSVAQGNTFVEGMTNGRGFIALALVIFGRWKPWGMVAGALFFGAAAQCKYALPGTGIGVSPQVIEMVPYAATLLALALLRRDGASGPAALAKPYRR
ncbi:MAG TPA: ABC transporter permease [Armatimonadota bacterium]